MKLLTMLVITLCIDRGDPGALLWTAMGPRTPHSVYSVLPRSVIHNHDIQVVTSWVISPAVNLLR